METISAIGIFSSVIYILLLFNKKKKSYSDKILIVWLFLFAIHLVLPFMMAIENQFFIEKVNGLDIGLYTLHITFLFYYSRSLTDNSLRFSPSHIFLLIPTASIYLIQGRIDSHIYLFSDIINLYFFGDNKIFHLTGVVSMNLGFCILFCTKFFSLLATHRKNLKNNYSYSENVDLRWVKNLNIATIVLTCIVALYLIGLLKGKLNEEWLNNLYFSTISLLVLILGYWGYKQGVIWVYVTPPPSGTKETLPEASNKASANHFKHSSSIVHKEEVKDKDALTIIDLMENKKLYLDPTLNIGIVANTMGMHVHQLSKLINQNFDQNFFDFVNNYRVEEFKTLVTNPKNKHFSILGLALDAGFNSKATFNRIFKNKTGLTPSQFRENFKY